MGVVAAIAAAVFVVVSSVYTQMLGIWNVLFPLFDGLVTYFLNVITAIMQIATGDWAGLWQTIQNQVTNAIATVQAVLLALLDWILAGWEQVRRKCRPVGRRFGTG